MPHHVAILGGGIAGLATATFLERAAARQDHPLRCTLLEASDRFGGKIRTETRDDFIMEHGPDSMLTRKPWAIDLCKSIGLEQDLIPCRDLAQKTWIFRDGKQVPLPAGLNLGIPTRLFPLLTSSLLSWRGRLRALRDLRLAPRSPADDESIACFFRRHLGSEMVERVVAPLLGGIYAGDIEQLSLPSAFPALADMERTTGSLIRGLRQREKQATAPAAPFTSLRHGMQSLIPALTQNLSNTELRSSWPAASVKRTGAGRFEIQSIDPGLDPLQADAVVVALPASVAATLLPSLLPAVAEELAKVRFSSSATVNLGFRSKISSEICRGYGFLVAPVTDGVVTGGSWAGNKFAGRCPQGHSLLRVFLGGINREPPGDLRDPAVWQEEALRFCRDRLGLTVTPDLCRTAVWHEANPQYNVGHLARRKRIDERVRTQAGLYLTGSSLAGFSLSDCVRDAERVALRCLQELVASD